jgi:hypothetical protein
MNANAISTARKPNQRFFMDSILCLSVLAIRRLANHVKLEALAPFRFSSYDRSPP